MANRTVKEAKNVHGTNPQYLIEKIIRSRIYDSKYWKEQCFALTAELLVDKAMELRFVGGVYGGNIKPTQFICLTLKMLQIQPEKDIVVEFIKNEEFKYVRALGAFYMRLTGSALECYKYLEPLYIDSRKLRMQNRNGQFEIIHMDEFIDQLLTSDRVCDTILPRIQKRAILEENNELEPRVSLLDEDLEDDLGSDEEQREDINRNDKANDKVNRPLSPLPKRLRRGRSATRSRSRSREHEVRNERTRDFRREKDDYQDRRHDRRRPGEYENHNTREYERPHERYERRDRNDHDRYQRHEGRDRDRRHY